MPSHRGGNDRSAQGSYAKNLKNPQMMYDNARHREQQNLERSERRARREELIAKSERDNKGYLEHVSRKSNTDDGSAASKVIKN